MKIHNHSKDSLVTSVILVKAVILFWFLGLEFSELDFPRKNNMKSETVQFFLSHSLTLAAFI